MDLAGRPCQAPRGRASAEMRELKASWRSQLHHPGFSGDASRSSGFREPQGCNQRDLIESLVRARAQLDAGIEALGVTGETWKLLRTSQDRQKLPSFSTSCPTSCDTQPHQA